MVVCWGGWDGRILGPCWVTILDKTTHSRFNERLYVKTKEEQQVRKIIWGWPLASTGEAHLSWVFTCTHTHNKPSPAMPSLESVGTCPHTCSQIHIPQHRHTHRHIIYKKKTVFKLKKLLYDTGVQIMKGTKITVHWNSISRVQSRVKTLEMAFSTSSFRNSSYLVCVDTAHQCRKNLTLEKDEQAI